MQNSILKRLTFKQKVRIPVPSSPQLALRTVISKDGLGVYASSDTVYRGAVFGRDSIEVAEDLLALRPKLIRTIILTLASLQGEELNEYTEEEPGKIVHEYRRTVVDGKPISGATKKIFEELAEKWGTDNGSVAFYASIDATPLFIRLVCNYCYLYGPDLLNTKVRLRSGHQLNMALVLENSLDWLIDKLESSKSGLLEFKRMRPDGYPNQSWKDSEEFYIHEDGQRVNHDEPVSSIELQGLAYDALSLAADIFEPKSVKYRKLAEELRRRTLELLWLPERDYFALGTDFSRTGKLRIIKTETANPAELLDSRFFDGLPEQEKEKYICGIARNIMGTYFLTDAGIRSRGLNGRNLVPFWDYHGSYTTWPKETYDIAKGFRRQGFKKLAVELENRLLNSVRAYRSYPEFLYVDYRGRVLGTATKRHHHAHIVLVKSTDTPEAIQSWTVSAVLAITSLRRRTVTVPALKRSRSRMIAPAGWRSEAELEILSHIPHVPRLRTMREIAAKYPSYPYEVSGARAAKYL